MSRNTWLMVVIAIVAFVAGIQVQAAKEDTKSPHVAALELVFKTQEARIRAVDAGNWWHDAEERNWVVRRPFMPGVIDSTHLFEVSYRIKGKEVLGWFVDTGKGTVEESLPIDEKKEK